MDDVTRILNKIEKGDRSAASELLPLVYAELRALARVQMHAERGDHTLQATALVHEAYIRLVDIGRVQHWDSRSHFFAAAAEAMRRILVDHARAKATQKRGGNVSRLDIDSVDLVATISPDQLLALDEAVDELERLDPVAAQLVQLRFFAGLGIKPSAQAVGISLATAYRHWTYARAWLHSRLLDEERA
jgi:RNA polymerase sigma factor (TIGR02999 family)